MGYVSAQLNGPLKKLGMRQSHDSPKARPVVNWSMAFLRVVYHPMNCGNQRNSIKSRCGSSPGSSSPDLSSFSSLSEGPTPKKKVATVQFWQTEYSFGADLGHRSHRLPQFIGESSFSPSMAPKTSQLASSDGRADRGYR